jgi:hypothetical protein
VQESDHHSTGEDSPKLKMSSPKEENMLFCELSLDMSLLEEVAICPREHTRKESRRELSEGGYRNGAHYFTTQGKRKHMEDTICINEE